MIAQTYILGLGDKAILKLFMVKIFHNNNDKFMTFIFDKVVF